MVEIIQNVGPISIISYLMNCDILSLVVLSHELTFLFLLLLHFVSFHFLWLGLLLWLLLLPILLFFPVEDPHVTVFVDFDQILNFRFLLRCIKVVQRHILDGCNSTSDPSLKICHMASPSTTRSFSCLWFGLQ